MDNKQIAIALYNSAKDLDFPDYADQERATINRLSAEIFELEYITRTEGSTRDNRNFSTLLAALQLFCDVSRAQNFMGFCVGDHLLWHVDEFDTVRPHDTPCILTDIYDDHAIAKTDDNITLWIDKDNLEHFRKEF